jgi:hypothetical protein
MDTGMLWFDNDSKTTLAAKVQRAAEYYHTKYGCAPNLCLVNPKAGTADVSGIEVRSLRSILPGHLWIGMAE